MNAYRTLHTLALAATLALTATAQKTPADYVNPFIGTTNFGTCNPGAVTPNGLMSCTPFNVMGSDLNPNDKDKRWWSTPYEINNVFFTGYAHVNLSGVGCPELGSLLTCPTAGALDVDYHNYGSTYSDEHAEPGYYTNCLTKYGIRTEATATPRSSRERYTFPEGQGHVLLNLGEGLTNESGAWLRKISDTEWEGGKLLGTFCYNPQAVFHIYFYMKLSKKPLRSGYWKKQRPMEGVEAEWDKDNGRYKLYTSYTGPIAGDDIGLWTDFDLEEGEQVEVMMGVSFNSTEEARRNLEAEQAGKTFETLRADASQSWNDALGRILVEGGTEDQRAVFYTALYHVLLHPNIGAPGTGGYTVFSLWDTYRNVSQLLTLVYPEKQRAMLRSMTQFARRTGWMPKWELYGQETYTMDGDPAAPYVADAVCKGLLPRAEAEEAYQYLRKSALAPSAENPLRKYNDQYMQLGFVPMYGGFDLSVSEALEYCIADYALAQMAAYLGHDEDAALFRERSLSYRRYYDKESGALRPLNADGTFLAPFNPRQGENFEPPAGFHEGSAWNYTFCVGHDVQGLAQLMGGAKKYVEKLEWIFNEGLYDPANEPDINYAYHFSQFRGHEAKTQKWARWALDKYFTNTPGGIPGNDDTGTMSAWAVFTMLGFYPEAAGSNMYTLTAPVFTKSTIDLGEGRGTLVIESDGDDRLTRVKKYRISHDELLRAGTLKLY
ncbi:MAG: GH92 family glycosyl hydrolase [Alloprevotella sp.]|nr:GH92 family glycosyl hydrolase [Alloprevotella sp.]